jgi:hypothetical protein
LIADVHIRKVCDWMLDFSDQVDKDEDDMADNQINDEEEDLEKENIL